MDFQLIDYIVYGLQLLMDFQLMEFKLMGYMLMDLTEWDGLSYTRIPVDE